jgi:hypothetical protein
MLQFTPIQRYLCYRYRDGRDYIAEHRDDERELDPAAPIASLSLGCARDFVFRHRDARKRGPQKREILPGTESSYTIVTLLLSRLLKLLRCKQNYNINVANNFLKIENIEILGRDNNKSKLQCRN